ncbi:adhesin [Nitrosomonas sp. HPC101]|uniref:adhesin n=1 Tax=Nitrosomonas sp. HPC101 TaxID=1658667 RepID=UPI00136CF445|nr:adhesin [Nitrosomonas sp. HPC101]MXS86526.1 adhesin [Nitrosomonas sp. HPC101]
MKTDNKQTTIQLLFASMFLLGLAACDNEQAATTNKKTVVLSQGPTTGILADSAVEGVSYSASSGAAGITDTTGLYKYTHGDNIEFSIGKLNLGKIAGKGLTTPIDLAAGDQNKLLNLLILFQSLDTDNNPGNGISIPQAAAAALDPSLDLTVDPGVFTTSPALTTAREAADIPGSIKTADEANTHFLSQAVNLLSNYLWINEDDDSIRFFRFSNDGSGEYLNGVVTPDDSCDANRACGSRLVFTAGIEYGTTKAVDYDERGFKLASMPEVDTNIQSGLSHTRPNWRIYTNGDELIISDIVIVQREREQPGLFDELFHITKPLELSSDDEVAETTVQETRYRKMDNTQGIVGAWAANKDVIKSPVFLFFPNNRYMLIDPAGGTAQSECAKPGVELATYSFDASSSTLKLSSFTYNTTGCSGLSGYVGKPITFKIDTDTQNATLSGEGLAAITLHRISH